MVFKGIAGFLSDLFGKKKQEIVVSPEPIELVPRKTKREELIFDIKANDERILGFFAESERIKKNKMRNREETAILNIYRKMSRALKVAHNYSNKGFKHEQEYVELKRVIDDLIDLKSEYAMNISADLKNKLDEVILAFRQNLYELNKTVRDKRLLYKLQSDEAFWRYLSKFKQASDIMIRDLYQK
ncbi:MAG: hypothetical protein Q7S33_03465 [Nanoarchaeota archaeon]|nr:hypothetical protein [Nanoarchaeota archaeon]